MASRSPAARLRRELESTLDGVDEEADPVETVGRLGARLILQQALEDEVTEYLAAPAMSAPRLPRSTETATPTTVRTTSGSVELERPRLRNASQQRVSEVTSRGCV